MSKRRQSSDDKATARNIFLIIAGVYILTFIIVTVIFFVQALKRIDDLQKRQEASEQMLIKKIDESSRRNRAAIDALAQSMGVSSQELARKTAALQRQEEEITSRVAAGEEQAKQVAGEVSGVKVDVGKMKEQVTATQTGLNTTNIKLKDAIGDITKHSEQIATTHKELDLLKHRGDRDYYEFTLTKGKEPAHMGAVGLQLKSVDAKRNRFTFYVLADDDKIEKRDKTVNEPLQFYAGRDQNLFEVVVYTMDDKSITGYLAAPKGLKTGLQEHPN
jgi:hypothetical protein